MPRTDRVSGRRSSATAPAKTRDRAPSGTKGPVDDYIAQQPGEVQVVLQRVRRIIRKVLPEAEESISYRIPAYRQDGRMVVYFAGWKQHFSLYPVSDEVRHSLGAELAHYACSKGTVRFPLDEPVPARLVERIVRALAGGSQHERVPRKRIGDR